MSRPSGVPIGLQLTGAAKIVGRAFADALAEVDGAPHTWSILLALKARPTANQREIAASVGIEGATLTHHLNAMERDGLLTRRRDPANRRVHLVDLTAEGEAAFRRMRGAAVAFDRRLRTGIDDDETTTFGLLLDRLRANVAQQGSTETTAGSVPSRSANVSASALVSETVQVTEL